MTTLLWAWPLPTLTTPETLHPTVSQEFRAESAAAPPHLGVDIMYRAATAPGAQTPPWFCPADATVCAAAAGHVWQTGVSARGHFVVVDHGAPFLSFYQHLASLCTSRGSSVKAGDALGRVGSDPTDGEHIIHLHFAIWKGGYGDAFAVDPTLYLPQQMGA